MKAEFVSVALSHEALFAKSQAYIRRGHRAKTESNLDEFQLWASLALELLAKSTLSSFHPALVADPTHLQSLFAACGVKKGLEVKTITAKTLFKRIGLLSKVFDHRIIDFCIKLAQLRNAEVHSGESPFLATNLKNWENHFWHASRTLLEMQSRSLGDWLSSDEAQIKQQLLNEADAARDMSVEARIENHRSEFVEKFELAAREKAIRESNNVSPWSFYKQFSVNVDSFYATVCPACGSNAVVGGYYWDEEVLDQDFESDSPLEWVAKNLTSEEFWCPVCKLRLEDSQEVAAAKVESEFTVVEEREIVFEPEYGND